MKLTVMVVYDAVAKVFFRPYYTASKEVGTRAFRQAALDPETELWKSPADYSLWCLGEFDDETGRFVLLEQPEKLCIASQFNRMEVVKNAS